MPRALFPALAISVFHNGPSTLGYLYAAPGAGALIGAILLTILLPGFRRYAARAAQDADVYTRRQRASQHE
jgi:hypothetical protein